MVPNTGKVPTLRFPEFSGRWNCYRLGDLTDLFSVRNKDGRNYPMYSVTNDKGFVPQSEKFEDRAMIGENINSYKIIREGDFAYNPARINVGSIARYQEEYPCMISSLYVCFKPDKQLVNSDLLLHILKSPRLIDKYKLHGEGGVRIYLFYPNFAQIKIWLPRLTEQSKIAKLLTLIEERITTQIRIIEDLKSERKFLLEQLFCLPKEHTPKLRLKGMTGDWYKVRLYDIVERITERNKANTCSRVLTIAAQYGLIDQQEFFNKQIASSDLTNYYLLHKGDFAYNKSYSGDYPWGAVKRLDNYNEGVLSSLYVCFRPNGSVDSDFLCHYFESTKWYRGISEISGEGARNHGLLNMSVDDYFNTIHRIPSLEEQRQISTMLNTIVQKIKIEESIIDKLQKQKSYLLKEMFV